MCSNIIAVASDSTTPGRIELTRIPNPPNSSAALRTSMSRAALLEAYAARNLPPRAPAIEDIAIMDPPDVLIVSAAA